MAKVDYKFVPLMQTWPGPQTRRRRGPACFKSDQAVAIFRLRREVARIEPRGPVIIEADFKAHDIGRDGQLQVFAAKPEFPGVIVHIDSIPYGRLQFVCDECCRWYHNLHALALALERLRLVNAYGVSPRGEQYQGWRVSA